MPDKAIVRVKVKALFVFPDVKEGRKEEVKNKKKDVIGNYLRKINYE